MCNTYRTKIKALSNICFSFTSINMCVLVKYILNWGHGERKRKRRPLTLVCVIAVQCCGWVTLWRRGLFALVDVIQGPRAASGNRLCLCNGKVPMVADGVTWQEAACVHVCVQSFISYQDSTMLGLLPWPYLIELNFFFFFRQYLLHSWGWGWGANLELEVIFLPHPSECWITDWSYHALSPSLIR